MNFNPELLDIQKMGDAEQMAMATGISGVTLMENAGHAVAEQIKKLWPQRPVSVLCGPGNNGGDGFVVARLLAAAGWPVRVGLLCTQDKLQGEALHHAKLWQGNIEPLSVALLEGAGLIVDALFGSGLTRVIDGNAAKVLSAIQEYGIPVVAVDVPSGVMGDTGVSLGAITANITVTFFRKKPAHLLMPGRSLCGEVIVADIGIPSSALNSIKTDVFENSPQLWGGYLPEPNAKANKYTRGHALVYGGYPMTGAARLAAHASARAGAGLTSIACPENALPVYAASLASIIVKPLATADDFSALLADKRLSAALIGPGAGLSKNIRQFITILLASGLPVVLDADAITAFKGEPEKLKQAIIHPCVMTPHEGEFAGIFNFTGDKLTRARSAAQYTGAIIILKGYDTVITSPDGRAIINSNAPATLATAGSGDVLSGIILGLLAQKMEPFLAAAAAVWLHAEAANEFGPGLIADDIADMLPRVFRKLSKK